MLRLRNVQVDVPAERYDEAVAFWAGALGASTRLAGGPYTHLVGLRATFGLHLQRLGSGPARYHLDLETDDVAAEAARLIALGASPRLGGDPGTAVLADPAGTLLCLVPEGEVVEQVVGRDPQEAYLDALVLDVPAPLQERTASFWAAAFEVPPFVQQRPGDPYLWSEGLRSSVADYDLGVQRLPAEEPSRVHVDTICDDVPGQVRRLLALGARPVAEQPRWQVLAAPAGHLLCVVDSSGGPGSPPA
jgi:hypothetical protein